MKTKLLKLTDVCLQALCGLIYYFLNDKYREAAVGMAAFFIIIQIGSYLLHCFYLPASRTLSYRKVYRTWLLIHHLIVLLALPVFLGFSLSVLFLYLSLFSAMGISFFYFLICLYEIVPPFNYTDEKAQ